MRGPYTTLAPFLHPHLLTRKKRLIARHGRGDAAGRTATLCCARTRAAGMRATVCTERHRHWHGLAAAVPPYTMAMDGAAPGA